MPVSSCELAVQTRMRNSRSLRSGARKATAEGNGYQTRRYRKADQYGQPAPIRHRITSKCAYANSSRIDCCAIHNTQWALQDSNPGTHRALAHDGSPHITHRPDRYVAPNGVRDPADRCTRLATQRRQGRTTLSDDPASTGRSWRCRSSAFVGTLVLARYWVIGVLPAVPNAPVLAQRSPPGGASKGRSSPPLTVPITE